MSSSGQLDGAENLTALETLKLWGTKCPHLEPLLYAPTLTTLEIRTIAAPPDPQVFRRLTRLRVLRPNWGREAALGVIPSAGLFSPLENLEEFNSWHCEIGDGNLEPFHGLKRLRLLALAGTYPKAAIERLRERLPDCELDLDARELMTPSTERRQDRR
jgi:hypothetical protein